MENKLPKFIRTMSGDFFEYDEKSELYRNAHLATCVAPGAEYIVSESNDPIDLLIEGDIVLAERFGGMEAVYVNDRPEAVIRYLKDHLKEQRIKVREILVRDCYRKYCPEMTRSAAGTWSTR